MEDDQIAEEFTIVDKLVNGILTTILLVVTGEKVNYAMDTTTVPNIKVGAIPGGVVSLFVKNVQARLRLEADLELD